MPPAPVAPPPYAAPYPALYLYPLNDSFVPKHISLVAGQRVKIGRQTNPKTAPGEKNGFFDSKVLSRQHAEIWEDGNKIYIKDVKSSNGTFINGERLSPEGVESEPYELKSDDIVEFGIDIVGEDNKTIIHHKVAARAVCVFSEQDAQIAARAEQHQQQQQQQQHLLAQQQQQQQQQQHQNPHHPHPQQQYAQQSLMGAAQPGPNGMPASQFNFVGSQRRPGVGAAAAQGALAGIGGMGGSMRPPGKSGLTFEHILNRLQGELQKSRETGSELHSLNTSMSEINDVLGGNMPSNVAPYPSSLPPVRPTRQTSPQQQQQQQPPQDSPPQPTDQQPSDHPPPPNAVSQFQSQLHDTQSSLAEYANKVRVLEETIADHELMRKEVHDLRQLFESRRQEITLFSDEQQRQRPEDDEEGLLEPRGGFDHDDDDDIQHIRMLDEVDEVDDDDEEDEGDDDDDDDDDRRSLATIIPHELERVEEEDEEQLAAAEREQVDELGGGDLDRADPIDPERERESSEERERQFEREAMRKQEDLNVGRPRTPEPSFGLRTDTDVPKDTAMKSSPTSTASPRTRSGTLLAPTSTRSPLALEPTTMNGVSNDQVLEQVLQLSAQISAMVKLTSSMESQYAAAQDTIRMLENKVGELERAVKEVKQDVKHEEEVKREDEDVKPPPVEEEEKEDIKSSLTSLFTSWQHTISSQWNEVREEWKDERERIRRTKEDWESRIINIDSSLEKMNQLHNTTTSTLVKEFGVQKQEMGRVQRELREVQLAGLRAVAGVGVGVGNGEIVNAHGQRGSGLVTPPSPRSQSSDSGGSGGRAARRRRRKRRSMSATAVGGVRGRAGGLRERGDEEDEGEEADEGLSGSESDDDEVTLASESGGVIDAVKVTESAPSNASIKSEEGTAATRAYPLSHHHHLDAQYPTLHDVYDETGSSCSSSQFASEEEVEEGKKVPGRPIRLKSSSSTTGASTQGQVHVNVKKEMMPTPESLTGSVVSEREDVKDSTGTTTASTYTKRSSSNAVVNFQTAGAVVVLAVAAAAVFWKVRSE